MATWWTESMGLMSIGEFAGRSRLSPKALRLYDELGLLEPARVDDDSGYRYYSASQLDRARLIAALRQLQIPLAEITSIVDLEPDAAAERITEHWNAIEARHTARQDLARARMTYLADATVPDRETKGPDCDFALPIN